MSTFSKKQFNDLIKFLNSHEPEESEHVIDLNDMDEIHIIRKFCGLSLEGRKQLFKKFAEAKSSIEDEVIVYEDKGICISISTYTDDNKFEFTRY